MRLSILSIMVRTGLAKCSKLLAVDPGRAALRSFLMDSGVYHLRGSCSRPSLPPRTRRNERLQESGVGGRGRGRGKGKTAEPRVEAWQHVVRGLSHLHRSSTGVRLATALRSRGTVGWRARAPGTRSAGRPEQVRLHLPGPHQPLSVLSSVGSNLPRASEAPG